ncbi:MAG: hypothetical protein QOJ94_2636 [Sphingomonadales bacterium]|jgi:hypothetical protein|nr:hypothetical protein [Sphingomonadales bacterium]
MITARDLYREWMRRLQLFLAAPQVGPSRTRRRAA